MKKILGIIMILGSLSSFAEYMDVKNVVCDGETRTAKEGERVYINLNKLFIGFGQTEDSCRVIDLYSVVVTSQGVFNGIKMQGLVPVLEVGRKSSCSEELSSNEDPGFESAILEDKRLTLKKAGSCDTLIYNLL